MYHNGTMMDMQKESADPQYKNPIVSWLPTYKNLGILKSIGCLIGQKDRAIFL